MISIRNSPSLTPSNVFNCSQRQEGEGNLAWLRRHVSDEKACLILVGGSDTPHVRLRMAQSQARNDLTPSHWSHVLVSTNMEDGMAYDIPLSAEQVAKFPPASNGLQQSDIRSYDDSKLFPNVAVIELPVTRLQVDKLLTQFTTARPSVDAVELMLQWLAFIWGVGRAENPLLDSHGMPSAVMAEFVLSGVGVELTPGLNSRSSCPEAIWQSLRWWHEYHKRDAKGGWTGSWHVQHKLVEA